MHNIEQYVDFGNHFFVVVIQKKTFDFYGRVSAAFRKILCKQY